MPDNYAQFGEEQAVFTDIKADKFKDGFECYFSNTHFSVHFRTSDTISGEYTILGDAGPENLIATFSYTGLVYGGLYNGLGGKITVTVQNDGSLKGTYSANCKSLARGDLQNCDGSFLIDKSLIKNKTKAHPVEDIDGNVYQTVLVGHQIWMSENLMATHYNDGTPINKITDKTDWALIPDGNFPSAYCYYNNDSTNEMGALYTFGAVINNRNQKDKKAICPKGWHLPSHSEWNELFVFLDSNGYDEPGIALKSKTGWLDSGNGTDDIGFNGLPAGFRNSQTGGFSDSGKVALWWTHDYRLSHGDAITTQLNFHSPEVQVSSWNLSTGMSVRCVID